MLVCRESCELPYCEEKAYPKESKTSSLRSELSFHRVSSGHWLAVFMTLIGLPPVLLGRILRAFAK